MASIVKAWAIIVSTILSGLVAAGCGGGRTALLPPVCDIRVSPTTVDFGKIPSGEVGIQEVRVGNVGGAECVLSQIRIAPASDPWFSVIGPDLVTLAPSMGTILTVWFAPSAAKLPLIRRGELEFDVNATSVGHVAVPLTAEIQANCKIEYAPAAVDFGRVALGDSVRRSVQLTNKGTDPCELRNLAIAPSSDRQFHLDSPTALALEPGEQGSIDLSFRAEDPAKPHHRTGSLTAATSDASKPTLAIPLSADIDVGCDLSWLPAKLDFGNVILNNKADGHVTLSNEGTDTCVVSNLAITADSDPNFQLGNNPPSFSVVPGGSATIAVTFTAADSSPPHLKTGMLVFQTGNQRNPTAQVPLSAYVTTVCIEASRWIYTLDESGGLARFDPTTVTFTMIAQPLRCPGAASFWQPNSMAVDQNAVAWVSDHGGKMFRVDVTTGVCEATDFEPDQHGLWVFGMGFVFDPSTGRDTLYIAGGEEFILGPMPKTSTLATVSFPDLVVTPVGTVAAGLPELSGTGDGQLWGFAPYDASSTGHASLMRIDPKTGDTLESYDYSSLTDRGAWAMKFWGGSFWMFLNTAVYKATRDNPSKIVSAGSYPWSSGIVGAGVSTCAPLQ
jgi:hypothetical protein